MLKHTVKKYPTIACCGIDCGLCPRFYTEGSSRCPGCAAEHFSEKHPSCGIVTCCVTRRRLETCAECNEYPCKRMVNWDKADSFVTHRMSLRNLEIIQIEGMAAFLKQQRIRIQLLRDLINKCDDGRSRSFYCLASALLPSEKVKLELAEITRINKGSTDIKQMAKLLRDAFNRIAKEEGIELKYRKGA